MIRSNLADRACPLTRAMGEIGDGWMMLTLWAALNGTTRFETMQERLGVARNILSDRLRRLVDSGLLERKPISANSKRCEYLPTQRARDLQKPLEMFREWGAKYCQDPEIPQAATLSEITA